MQLILIFLSLVFLSQKGLSLPIGFGRNMGGLDYIETKNPHFIVYADSRTPVEAKFALYHLNQSKEFLETWFRIQRKNPLPVIISAETFNASFANFITDVLEIQTFGQASRDLVFHEFVHSTSYRHLDNWLGPAGSVLHLPWLPSWWLEGVAEALSVSVGSATQASFEMNAARTNSWPSYARLHSLYQKESFALEGYAISGAFSTYLLRKMKDEKDLAHIHQSFFKKSMPWQWPYAILPGVDSLPMDRSLKELFGKNGEELYEEYKDAAKNFWNHHSKILNRSLATNSSSSELVGNTPKLVSFFTRSKKGNDLFLSFEIVANNTKQKTQSILYESKNLISNLRLIGEYLIWIEQDHKVNKNQERICQIHFNKENSPWNVEKEFNEKAKSSSPICSPFIQMQNLKLLNSSSNTVSEDIFVLGTLELEFENLYSIYKVNLQTMSLDVFKRNHNSAFLQILAVANQGTTKYVSLVEDRFQKRVQFLDAELNCVKEIDGNEFYQKIQVMDETPNIIQIQIQTGNKLENLSFDIANLPQKSCSHIRPQTSPLLEAIKQKKLNDKVISLKEALNHTSSWKSEEDASKMEANFETVSERISDSFAHEKINELYETNAKSNPAKWRGRTVASVPWVGNDNSGLNYGILSLPIMDHLQNESLRLSMLYGVESRFPSTDLLLESTRFYPTLTLSVSRSQIWNGVFQRKNLYYDENSITAAASFELPKFLSTGKFYIKRAFLKPLVGPNNIAKGHYTEFSYQHSIFKNFSDTDWSLGLNLSAKSVPEFLSEDFEYNQISLSPYIKRSNLWRDSLLLLQIDTSRTRGSKRRYLQEVYRPLKIYIPGDGGGVNDLNFPIYGSSALFSGMYGDTSAKSSLTWSLPLIKNFDYLFKIFYLDRLDWNQFVSYGGAWRGDRPNLSKDDFLFAHGYNLDLQIDVKGLRFNSGVGTGQVVGFGWDIYFTFGFDAIF